MTTPSFTADPPRSDARPRRSKGGTDHSRRRLDRFLASWNEAVTGGRGSVATSVKLPALSSRNASGSPKWLAGHQDLNVGVARTPPCMVAPAVLGAGAATLTRQRSRGRSAKGISKAERERPGPRVAAGRGSRAGQPTWRRAPTTASRNCRRLWSSSWRCLSCWSTVESPASPFGALIRTRDEASRPGLAFPPAPLIQV